MYFNILLKSAQLHVLDTKSYPRNCSRYMHRKTLLRPILLTSGRNCDIDKGVIDGIGSLGDVLLNRI